MNSNRRVKQILAIIGLVIIVGLYIVTLVLALSGSENTKHLFTASIVCTVMVPVILYIINWLYKMFKGKTEDVSGKDSDQKP